MDRPVALIPLVCLKCSTPIPAGPEEVAWVCAQCGQGQALDDDKGLIPLEIRCLHGIPPQGKGKPFWVVEGKVSLERDTYSGNQAGEAQQFWAQPRLFFVPNVPAWLYRFIGDWGFRRAAKKHGTIARLGARPYAA